MQTHRSSQGGEALTRRRLLRAGGSLWVRAGAIDVNVGASPDPDFRRGIDCGGRRWEGCGAPARSYAASAELIARGDIVGLLNRLLLRIPFSLYFCSAIQLIENLIETGASRQKTSTDGDRRQLNQGAAHLILLQLVGYFLLTHLQAITIASQLFCAGHDVISSQSHKAALTGAILPSSQRRRFSVLSGQWSWDGRVSVLKRGPPNTTMIKMDVLTKSALRICSAWLFTQARGAFFKM